MKEIIDDIAIQLAQNIEAEKYVSLFNDSFKYIQEDEKVQFFFKLSLVLFSRAYYKHSISLWKYCLNYSIKNNDLINEALCCNNLGEAYNKINEHDTSIQYLIKASKIHENIDNKEGQIKSYNNLGSLYLSLCQYNEALRYCKRALELIEQIPDSESKKFSQSVSYSNLGLCFHFLGNYEQALKYHYKCL